MKKGSCMVSIIFSLAVVFSVLNMNFISMKALALSQPVVKGNVPVNSEPNSRLIFDADGSYKVIFEEVSSTITKDNGCENGGRLVNRNSEVFSNDNQKILDELEKLPVYPYEEYYIAHEGAVAQYDDQGKLIRVRGDYEYYSTLDQYYVNGELPDGRYVGTFLEFGTITGLSTESGVMPQETTSTVKMPHASVYNFSTQKLGNSEPFDMTLRVDDLIWQTNATFAVSGSCTKPAAKLSFELYRKVDGEWIRIARKINVSCTNNGLFEWCTSYGADGEYGLKIWHVLGEDEVVKITGNLIYFSVEEATNYVTE